MLLQLNHTVLADAPLSFWKKLRQFLSMTVFYKVELLLPESGKGVIMWFNVLPSILQDIPEMEK